MNRIKELVCGAILLLFGGQDLLSQKTDLTQEVTKTMLNATKFMVDSVSTRGGYVRLYRADLSRRWAELEVYETQIAIRTSGTTEMGSLFLDCYESTGDEYYYEAARKVANALIFGQLPSGGWDYIIDFAGVSSLKEWYNTIGRNAWGWDEYNHYYGTATHKQNTTEAARLLLKVYLQKLDPSLKPALDKAIGFFIESQYPLGGWPQRYPLKYDHPFQQNRDYTSFYSFNDDITWENIEFLIQCYHALGEERLLDPIMRAMNFSLITQKGPPQAGWAEQYDLELKPANGRQYEPAAISPLQTAKQVMHLMRFYQFTGDRKFLAPITSALNWLESCRLPEDKTEDGRYTHPLFVEIGTNKPLYVHRKGTGITDGTYWVDHDDSAPLLHYGAKANINILTLREQYNKAAAMNAREASKNSPLLPRPLPQNENPQKYFTLNPSIIEEPDHEAVYSVIRSLDRKQRWLSKNEWVSRPYAVSQSGEVSNTAPLSTEQGAQIPDTSNQEYISTKVYIDNMKLLNGYLLKRKNR